MRKPGATGSGLVAFSEYEERADVGPFPGPVRTQLLQLSTFQPPYVPGLAAGQRLCP
jgi:hypothetical protein